MTISPKMAKPAPNQFADGGGVGLADDIRTAGEGDRTPDIQLGKVYVTRTFSKLGAECLVIVDEQDSWVFDHRIRIWSTPKKRCKYAYITVKNPADRTNSTHRLHRLILGAKPGEIVDHMNGDGLDNRRCNMRLASIEESNINRRGWSKRSPHKGVYPTPHGRWTAQIKRGGRDIYLGSFATPEDASDAVSRHLSIAEVSP